MPSSDLALAPLQEWMQAVVTHPGDVHEAVEAGRIEAGSIVLPSKSLQPVQRIGIYHSMYLLRMIEALEVDYEALVHVIGAHDFSHLVTDYVQSFPSRSWTLNRLGDHLPDFIAASQWKRRLFLADLARLELAMTHVFEEKEVAPLPADAIAAVPPEQIAAIRFTPVPALRLLECRYDVNDAFQAFREGRAVKPVRGKSWLAVHRREYAVYRLPLSQHAFAFLRSLISGETIGSAIMIFQRRFRRLPEQQELFTWFRDWSAAGLFAAIAITE